MQLLTFLYPALLTLLLSPTTTLSASSKVKVPKEAILLSSVKTLTLRSNAKTAHRRVSAVPQLVCKGPGCQHYNVDIMRCKNQGSSYGEEDIEWSCTASMPEEFKLGSTEVGCEGYSSSEDPYVLKGSCGVEYRLVYTDKGEEKYRKGDKWFGGGKGKGEDGEWTWSSVIFVVLFLAVAIWILSSFCASLPAVGQQRRPNRRGGGGWGGGWGGGGGGGGDPWDPPPPYPGTKPYGSTDQQGWRPGFWSGTAAGAAAGYAAGRSGNRTQQQPAANNNSWFGGGNSGSSFGSAGRSGSSSSGSSARHESTGFGSTSRR